MNIVRFRGEIDRTAREIRNKHYGAVFWFTGLSGSGKSTIAHTVEKQLFDMDIQSFVFDGDNVRHGLCKDLGFSQEDRTENLRRIAETTKLFAENGTVCMCAFIAPLLSDRQQLREIIGDDYYEIYVNCPLEVCESRDVKGYYKRARAGEIKNYTGISAPYDRPHNPDLTVNTSLETLDESTDKVRNFILDKIALNEADAAESSKEIHSTIQLSVAGNKG